MMLVMLMLFVVYFIGFIITFSLIFISIIGSNTLKWPKPVQKVLYKSFLLD